MQSRHFDKEQTDFLLTGNVIDDCQDLSLTGKNYVRICCWRNLPPNPTIKTLLAALGKKISEQQGKITHENTPFLLTWEEQILSPENSVWLQLLIGHYWHFLTLAFLTAFLPFLPSLSKHLSSSYLCFWQLTNSLCWLSECPSLWTRLWLLVLVIYLFEIIIYWIAIESNYF